MPEFSVACCGKMIHGSDLLAGRCNYVDRESLGGPPLVGLNL